MSSELDLLELYLNLLEHRDPRFSDHFAPFQGFREFSEHMRILEIGQIYVSGLETVLIKLPSLRTCKYVTSSTAQGGGGSFKNRKPIGEIGCCESRMAERIH